MIEKIKDNFLIILLFIYIIFCGVISLVEYNKDAKIWYAQDVEFYDKCQTDPSFSPACNNMYKNPIQKRDTLNTFGYITVCYRPFRLLSILMPLFVMIIVTLEFNRKLRKGYFKNSIMRIGYKNSFLKLYSKSLKITFVLPFLLVILLICCYFVSGNFDYEYGVYFYRFDSFGVENCKNIVLFLIVYLSNFILHGIFWVNIAIYNCRHNKHSIVSIVFSYIEYLLLFVISSLIGRTFFPNSTFSYYFSFTYIWSFHYGTLLGILIFSLVPALLSTIILLLSYKNNEKALSSLA